MTDHVGRQTHRHAAQHARAAWHRRIALPVRRRAFSHAHRAAAGLLIAGALGCADSTGTGDSAYDIDIDFTNGAQGWAAGFVDYPVGKETEWAISSSLASLPAPLDGSRKGILLTGENRSDDLFMYISRGVNLSPNVAYGLRYRVTIATNAPRNCAGIGGAPGESVVLKVGATAVEPARIVDAAQYYRANFDHGSQTAGGRDASPVGDLANSNSNCSVPRYELKQFDSGSTPINVTADASGRIWLVIGVDSGFEGKTAVYVTAVRVEINPR